MQIAFREIRNSSQHFVTYPFNELDRLANATVWWHVDSGELNLKFAIHTRIRPEC